jgi:RHS repeat-associated protein
VYLKHSENQISATQVSLPKGGGAIQGIGETFQASEFTGTATLSIPIPTSPSRGVEPQLSIGYSSGSGNGIFGLGFSLSIPNISRKTSKGIPQYNQSDTFLLSNAEDLVPLIGGEQNQTINNINYTVITYRPRIEGLFAKIECWTDQKTRDFYWQVVSTDNVTSIFGRTESARIYNPDNPNQVFQWLLEETFDAKGNCIVYEYKQENADNVPAALYEMNRSQTANKYIERIKYGNATPIQGSTLGSENAQVQWHFEVVFDYGEYNIDPTNSKPYTPVQQWGNRQDPFSTYNAGFEIRTHRLCRNVLMFHRFAAELGSEPILVHATRFQYQETPTVTLLSAVESVGYRFRQGQGYETKGLPPLQFKYTAFQPTGHSFEPFLQENGHSLPGLNLPPNYMLVDLYGEGIPGILYSDGKTTLYWEPQGDGKGEAAGAVRYAPPQEPAAFPIERNLQGANQMLMDITGNGQLDLMVSTPTGSGYYECNPDRSWKNFQTFESFPTDFRNPDNELVDVTGDGLADILFVENERVWVYPCQGEKGFGVPLICNRENGMPLPKRGEAREALRFADMFGSGMQHLVRITDGMVECWPNLGYGRFGKKMLLANAPHFGTEMDAERLFLADIDGSGTADLIYVYPERVEIFFNQSGNSFSEPLTIPLPSLWDRLNQISFADVYGNGTTCLVFSENHPQPRHWCYDFSQHQKPYLLNEINNNLGATTKITYCSSTKFYLEDKQNGKPWMTNLPFPVQVVEKTESLDLISDTKLVSSYTYHHGYYDGIEGEFRGFGLVERQDAETLSVYAKSTDVPPVLTKTWYHVGAWEQENLLSRQYEKEYFQGDKDAYLLPDSVFDYKDYQQQNPNYQPDAVALREVRRALKGMVLREEVYALDHSPLQNNPYTVTETNYSVRLLQPQGKNKYGVYFVHPQETLAYHYERNPDDPRIQHDFVLEITPFGNVKTACSVHYGRRPSKNPNTLVYPEQVALKATVQLGKFIEVTEPFRIIGVLCEQKVFEIAGLDLQGQSYFSFDRIRQQVGEALNNQVLYGVAFSPNTKQVRLFSWQQSYFWNLIQDEVLPLGQITERALLHHQQQAVFSDEWLQAVYGNKLDQTILSRDGGYFKEDNGYWWNKGLVQYYFKPDQPEGFYLPCKTENDFARQATPPQADGLFAKTIVTYDSYYLVPVKTEAYITDTEKNVTTAAIDYQTLNPWQLTDMNQVIHQVLFDPLGMVVVTSIFKEASDRVPRDGDGNLLNYKLRPDASFEKVLANQADYLQDATSYFYYNLFAWQEKGQPASYISLMRQTHVSDLQTGEQSVIQAAVGYSDGFGRVVEEKLAVEPGEAILRDEEVNLRRDENGQPVRGGTSERWLVSGRTVYNNKGKAAEQYLPYYSNTPLYETQQEIVEEKLVPPPTVIWYDPLLREIKVDTPKGFFSKVEFTAWETQHYDENDTVKDSPFYQQFVESYPDNPTDAQRNEKNALDKALVFYDTPHITVLDTLGNAFLGIENNLGAVPEDAFQEIVTGGVTSKAVWDALVEKGYLEIRGNDAHAAWGTRKFKPYSSGFKDEFIADLAEPYKSFGEAILHLLKQSCLTSYHKFDIQGREIESIDPRLYYANVTQGTAYSNFKYQYAMGVDGEAPWATDSADAGLNLSLNNIFGSFLWNRSPRNFEQVIDYDRLQRQLKIRVKGFKNDGTIATDNVVETFTYGETQPQAEDYNLRGQVYQHQDQSGVIINRRYNLQGELLETTRQFTQEYKDYINWDETVLLEAESYTNPYTFQYTFQYTFNALQRLISETTPDGSVTTNAYNQAGLLSGVTVKFKDGTLQPIINQIDYNANHQRVAIAYASGVKTTYIYEDTTLHLIKLYSTRPDKDARGNDRQTVIQDIAYTYDPVGNITRTYDKTYETVFYNNQKVEPLSDYTYDALYRLIKANGRQHPGINSGTYRNNEKDGDFKQSKFIPLPDDGNKLENYSEVYTYDEAGNLIKTAHIASNSWTRSQEIMPNSNRLKSVSSKNGISGSQDVSYDSSGNQKQLNINSTVNLTWNCCENLVKVGIIERPDELDDCDYYTYDSNELRTRKVSKRMANGGAIVWKEEKKYLGNYEVKLLKNETPNGEGIVLKRYTLRVMDEQACVAIIHYWEQDDLKREVETVGTRKLRYQLGNHLGSVSLEVDDDAQVISYEEYFPYGGTALIAGKSQKEVKLKEYRYSGKERDDATGLYYYGARYYAPWLGRWMSCDPAGTVDGLNLYGFVGGNPVSDMDIGGMMKRPSASTNAGLASKKMKLEDELNDVNITPGGIVPPPDKISVKKGKHWTEVHEKMKERKSFIIEIALGKSSKSATLEPRHQKGDIPNYFFVKHSGFAAGQSSDYGVFPTFISKNNDYMRISSRVIKGSLKNKGFLNAGLDKQEIGKAVLFGGLAITSEWARHSISPFVALVVLGNAKHYETSLGELVKEYIPASKGGAEDIKAFGDKLQSLNANTATTNKKELKEFYDNYSDFFKQARTYIMQKKKTKLNYNYEESWGQKAGTVLAFMKYVKHLQGKYPHLSN